MLALMHESCYTILVNLLRRREMLKKNEIFEVEIEDMNFLGFGVAKIDGCVVFVSGAVTGDMVKIRIIKVSRTYAVARTESILIPSSHRVCDECKVSASCGGCAFRAVDYNYECSLKESAVMQSFIRHGLRDVTVAPLVSNSKIANYRNKAQYPVRRGANGKTIIGFFAAKSHRALECADCALQNAAFLPIVEEIRGFIDEKQISVYDEESGNGLLRHIYLRIGEATGEIMLCLVLNGTKLPHADEFSALIFKSFPTVKSLFLNFNEADTNVVLGERFELLAGKPYIEDILCGIRLRITPQSFYQVNHDAAELLYSKAAELAALTGCETLLDLYCGIGSIGLSMAQNAKRLIGIETVASAVECAKENAAQNCITNAAFYCGDAADTEKLLCSARDAEGEFRPDVVILDPPRKGCAERLLADIKNLGANKIVYISCNPDTLARDAKFLTTNGWSMGTVFPFDLFCRTGHVECVVLMSKVQN